MKDLNLQYAELIRDRYEENLISGKAALDYMNNSTAVYGDVPVACLYLPKLFSKPAWEFLQQASNTICTILDKVIERYLVDPEYRKLFPFSPDLEKLILSEAGYPRLLPIARLDIFFDEEDFSFHFCEFNADGASAMNEDRELNAALGSCDALLKMKEEYNIDSFELFDSWVKEFMDIYGSYNKKVMSPRIIITDFMNKSTKNEFIEFQKAFQKAGLEADICDIRDFSYSDNALRTPDGKKVDAIYRRAVTRDIMEQKDEVSPFIQAAQDNAVCMIGHFRTQVIHNKRIFLILRLPETLNFLSDVEREFVLRHIPETLRLRSGDFNLEDVLNNKDNWVIKPEDFYGSHGVHVGIDMDAKNWRKVVTEKTGKDYLLQRYCTPYRSLNMDFNFESRPDLILYNNITGMFIYNGKLQGLYSRAGSLGRISSHTEGMTMVSLLVHGKKESSTSPGTSTKGNKP